MAATGRQRRWTANGKKTGLGDGDGLGLGLGEGVGVSVGDRVADVVEVAVSGASCGGGVGQRAPQDGVGPASYALREDVPDKTLENENRILPLRALPDWALAKRDPDPRGFTVVGADGAKAGQVVDVWVDRADPMVRYLEVEGASPSADVEAVSEAMDGAPPATNRTLVPINFAHIRRGPRQVVVKALQAAQIRSAPGPATPDQVTLQEEDRIAAYFGGGMLYATPARAEPLI